MADKRQARGRAMSRGQEQRPPPRSQGPPPSQQPQGAWAHRGEPAIQPQQSRPGPPPQQQQSAWATRPAAPPNQPQIPAAAAAGAVAGGSRPQPNPNIGRGVDEAQRMMGEVSIGGRREQAAASADITAGRGGMRGGGRTVNEELLVTKPSNCPTKKGSSGKSVKLLSNYFKLLKHTDWCLYLYRVDIAPDEDRTIVRKGLLKQHQEALGLYMFDGTVLYTSRRLKELETTFTSERREDNKIMTIKVKFVGEMARGDHHYLQFFNIVMRKCLEHLQLQLVGRNYFDAKAKVEIREFKLELWPGYLTSIRQHEDDILMCAEITNKVMRIQSILEIMKSAMQSARGQDWQKLAGDQIIGTVVLTDYNNETYRVTDIDWKVTPMSEFQLRTGEKISYCSYYQKKYNLRITDMQQPLLVSLSKARDRRAGKEELIYLVPELCRATGLTDQMRNNFQLMKCIGEYTRVGPKKRIEKLMAFNNRLFSQREIVQEFQQWDLMLDRKLVEVTGRELDAEKIFFEGGKRQYSDPRNPVDWTPAFRNHAMFLSVPLKQWVLISPMNFQKEVMAFINDLKAVSAGIKFPLDGPQIKAIQDDRAGSYTTAIENVMSSSNPQLIFCVVPNNRADRYSAIKKKCSVDRPVPSQVGVVRTLTKGKSVATKIAVQLNCKIGGSAWACDMPMSGLMVVGFDVCHDTNQRGKDFGAMVASLDKGCTRYFSAVSSHTNGEELSNDFALNMIHALNKYKEVNNSLPTRIVVYRDGVGEGQIPYVYDHELKQLNERLQAFYEGSGMPLRMAVILVTKRINTRFFKGDYNPAAGTVVDDIVTNPARYDFFLVSQHVGQGTVTPTGYSVLQNDTGLDPDKMQRLTYKMCHMYFNWPGTVRVPAPCQYAHKLAFVVSQAIHFPPATQLNTLLHFL